MTFTTLAFDVSDRVATITINRPDKLNALNDETIAELGEAIELVGRRDDIGGVILTGSGSKAFVAGADIAELARQGPLDGRERALRGQRVFTSFERSSKPVIAAVNGFALGGGCELALACDFRIAAADAKLGQPEIGLGIIPGAGGTQRLPRLIGPAKAKDLVFSGRFVDAAEALAIGLVDQVVAPDDVYGAACDLVRRYVGGPAYALRAAKEAIDRGLGVDLDTGLEIERMQFAALFATKDRATGMASFVEHGPGKAAFEGR